MGECVSVCVCAPWSVCMCVKPARFHEGKNDQNNMQI